MAAGKLSPSQNASPEIVIFFRPDTFWQGPVHIIWETTYSSRTTMTIPQSNPIYREMLLDIRYRLRLAEGLYDEAGKGLVNAVSLEDFAAKAQTIEQTHAYTQALQIIYADFLHLSDDCHVSFPVEPSLWQWNEPNGDEAIATTLDRLKDIADGLEMKLDAALGRQEATV